MPSQETTIFEAKKKYDHVAEHLTADESIIATERFIYNDEMFGNKWGNENFNAAKTILSTTVNENFSEKFPTSVSGWLLFYQESGLAKKRIKTEDFTEDHISFHYIGKLEDTYVWHWTREPK